MQHPKYVPLRKGKAKVPTNLDDIDNLLITLSLLKGVLVEITMTRCISTMKFEYWDLTDTTKFPHLATSELMEQSAEGTVTTLQPKEWMRKVEKAELLCLLSIPHFLWPPITILVIRQLLCLVHDGYLWLDKPIHITIEPIHRISLLPCEGRDQREIVDKSGNVTMIETMKKSTLR